MAYDRASRNPSQMRKVIGIDKFDFGTTINDNVNAKSE